MFSSIIKKAIEIGCRTGQATQPILKTECSLIAIWISARLCNYGYGKITDKNKASRQDNVYL